jgi:glutamine synthetase
MTPEQVLAMAKEKGVKIVDLRFMDFPGMWQHFTVPISELDESSFEDGFGFDGSSIRGWQPINASDMLVIPGCGHGENRSVLQGAHPGAHLQHRRSHHPRGLHPRSRNIAKKVEAYLKSTGIGDTAFIGPEAEFFIFDDIRYESVRQTVPSMPSIPLKAPGTRAAVKSPTWDTNRATRKATSPCRRRTSSRICAPRCC